MYVPRVSIGLPVLNGEEYIRLAVESSQEAARRGEPTDHKSPGEFVLHHTAFNRGMKGATALPQLALGM
jgi:hypothetical protein